MTEQLQERYMVWEGKTVRVTYYVLGAPEPGLPGWDIELDTVVEAGSGKQLPPFDELDRYAFIDALAKELEKRDEY